MLNFQQIPQPDRLVAFAPVNDCNADWSSPLYDNRGNSLNPCFISFVNILISGVLGFFALVQIFQVLFANHYGPFPIKYSFGSILKVKSVGIYQLLKFNNLVIQSILYLVLILINFSSFNLRFYSLAVSALVNVLILFPLHLLEPTRSVVGHASLLLYWSFSVLFCLVVLIQDYFGAHKIYIPRSTTSEIAFAHTIEIGLLLNSTLIWVLEYFLYSPSIELTEYFDLNEWDPKTVRDVFSEFALTWMTPTIMKAYEQNDLAFEELPQLDINLRADVVVPRINKIWEKQVAKSKLKAKKTGKEPHASLYWTLLKANSLQVMIGIFWSLLKIVTSNGQPLLLKRLILFFSEYNTSDVEKPPLVLGYFITLCLFLFSVLKFISFNRYYLTMFAVGFKCQSFLSSSVYAKSLKLSPEARKGKSTGDIVNHLSVDVPEISYGPEITTELLVKPIELILCLTALYSVVGNALWGGFFVSIIMIPISSFVSNYVTEFYNIQMQIKDERTSLTSEILTSMKSVKLYSWEKPMLARLSEIRNGRELVNAKKIGILNAVALFLWSSIPFFISCASFIIFAYYSGVTMTPAVVFPALGLFNSLNEPLLILPDLYSNFVEANVSLKRLRKFLLCDELDTDFIKKSYDPLKLNDTSVRLEKCSFVWNREEKSKKALENIDFVAKKGQLTCIVGRVGAGKSALVKAILGEVPFDSTSSGLNFKFEVNGTKAYCSQNPWILNASIKENILFGNRYDKAFYQKTVEACQLLPDFDIFADGDRTVVGENGISLSGGQKARISIARAVYSRSDVYLLDDILSAVDSHVGKALIEQVLGSNGLLATKTIILATNSVSVLHSASNIYYIEDGKIVESGCFDDVIAKQGHLTKLIQEFGQMEKASEVEQEEAKNGNHSEDTSIEEFHPDEEGHELERTQTHTTIGAASLVSFGHNYRDDDEDEDGVVRKMGHNEEKSAKGGIKLAVYLEYFKACNYSSLIFYLVMYGSNVGLGVLSTYILKNWSERNASADKTLDPTFYLVIYSFAGITGCACSLFGSVVVWSYSSIRSARYFHDKMAQTVLRSPMSFFETTPIGRILNRFSEDINVIDGSIVWTILGFTDFLLHALSLFVIIVYNLPFMAIVLIVLSFWYNSYRTCFIPASRILKRIRSVKKSPVFSHLQESVNGVETLRAYQQEDRFIFMNKKNVDSVTSADNTMISANRWLSMRLQYISSMIVCLSSVMIMSSLSYGTPLSPGLVGFIMSYVLDITGSLNAIVRFWADIESKSVALERVVEYCNLKPEAEMVIENNRPVASWPSDGSIEFKNYSTRYRENLSPVLKNISLNIKPSEKIGIVGRTGAGKSSLTLALFRIIEPIEGNIDIDSINTSNIGLYDLRYHLNIIPQEAHAFEGTIRQNLDPFDDYTDEELWKVLELAHLKKYVENMSSGEDDKEAVGLKAKVLESGSNLSSGQRQLLCLARALLKKTRVLILDEATAAVDVQTDKIIQQTIKDEFSDRTIISIAHRIDTVMHSDRILVLDKGEIKEFDSPKKLLENKDSIFYSLCKEGGYLDS